VVRNSFVSFASFFFEDWCYSEPLYFELEQRSYFFRSNLLGHIWEHFIYFVPKLYKLKEEEIILLKDEAGKNQKVRSKLLGFTNLFYFFRREKL